MVTLEHSNPFEDLSTWDSKIFELYKHILHGLKDVPKLVEEDCVENNENCNKSLHCLLNKIRIDPRRAKNERVGFENFTVLKLIGEGSFGEVYQVQMRDTSKIFAMKVIRKDKIIGKDDAQYFISERDILTKLDHPFVVHLRYSFQTKYRLYLVLDFINGGDIFFHLSRQNMFSEDMARVCAAEIISAVSYLHANDIMHRDLKPENILLDSEGHIVVTDFGFAKQLDGYTRCYSKCGTLEYMAPEVLLGKGYDKAADWWSFGALLFQMLTGVGPFTDENRERKKTVKNILNDKLLVPLYLTPEAHSLLKGLLQKEPSKRLGSGITSIEEIKGHKWFESINWKRIEAREIKPNFIPAVAGTMCVANFDEEWTKIKMPLLESAAATPKCSENQFKGFSFFRD